MMAMSALSCSVLFSMAIPLMLPAAAEASLEFSVPIDDEIPQPPDQSLTLTFPARVDLAATEIEVFDVHQRKIPIMTPERGTKKTDITVPLGEPLEPGMYTVKWHGTLTGGRKFEGSYSFDIGP